VLVAMMLWNTALAVVPGSQLLLFGRVPGL
jgi:hypothetical protein